MRDTVNHPAHYDVLPGIEAIEIIRKVLTPEQFQGYCMGCALKYRLRAGKKGDALEDLAKAEKYLSFLEDT